MTDPQLLSFYFDPACPWTWITSRWFVDVTSRRGIDVRWRAFSLSLINADDDVPAEYQEPMNQSHRALRIFESLYKEERHETAGQFYTQLGNATFVRGEPFTKEVIDAAASAAGIDDIDVRGDSEENEALVQAAFNEIRPLVGDDVGSPSILDHRSGKAIFGPVVNPAPTGDEADVIFDAMLTLLPLPTFFEFKRTRTSGPDFS